jgi:hypothetical protein
MSGLEFLSSLQLSASKWIDNNVTEVKDFIKNNETINNVSEIITGIQDSVWADKTNAETNPNGITSSIPLLYVDMQKSNITEAIKDYKSYQDSSLLDEKDGVDFLKLNGLVDDNLAKTLYDAASSLDGKEGLTEDEIVPVLNYLDSSEDTAVTEKDGCNWRSIVGSSDSDITENNIKAVQKALDDPFMGKQYLNTSLNNLFSRYNNLDKSSNYDSSTFIGDKDHLSTPEDSKTYVENTPLKYLPTIITDNAFNSTPLILLDTKQLFVPEATATKYRTSQRAKVDEILKQYPSYLETEALNETDGINFLKLGGAINDDLAKTLYDIASPLDGEEGLTAEEVLPVINYIETAERVDDEFKGVLGDSDFVITENNIETVQKALDNPYYGQRYLSGSVEDLYNSYKDDYSFENKSPNMYASSRHTGYCFGGEKNNFIENTPLKSLPSSITDKIKSII